MYRGRDFEMVGVSLDDPQTRDKVQAFLKENQVSYPNYLFDGQDVAGLIRAVDPKWEAQIPYTLIIKPGGEVLYRRLGMIDPLEVKRVIVGYLGRTYK